jgi:xanthine dehydrogenase small subunit
MREAITFLLDDRAVTVSGLPPTTTVLEYLRTVLKLTGTKEGCAEGDCGACTAMLGERDATGWHYKAVNACILFLPALDGKRLLTVEHLRRPDGNPHPVQRAMVERHASQCGFCTPGFVISLAVLHESGTKPTRQEIDGALAGNLCRCTGYRPIVDAAVDAMATDPVLTAPAPPATTGSMTYRAPGGAYFAPRSVGELDEAIANNPGAVFVAGSTDLGLVVTKQHRTLPTLIALDGVAEIVSVGETGETIEIGAAATYETVLPILERHYPSLGAMMRRIGSRQIRNRGTIGGNIANASPIGDMPPALLALDASLVLRGGARERVVKLDDFFTGYRQTVLAPGECIVRIDVPSATPDVRFHCYKVAKRFDQDISAVCGAFRLTLDGGIVRSIRIGFGGMAATPARAPLAEAALLGETWTEATVKRAMDALDADFAPLSDMRASAGYRRTVARNLLLKLFAEVRP